MCAFLSNQTEVVCLTDPLHDESLLNVSLPVVISWNNTEVPDKETGFSFTYGPDPVITDITPNKTIVGWVNSNFAHI